MALWGDYHTHSIYSHGKGSVDEIVARAKEIGLKEIGITDHGILNYPNNMRPHQVEFFIKDIKAAREQYDIGVFAGIEANLISLDGKMDLEPEWEEQLDYVICGYHSVRAMQVSPRKLFNMFLPNLFYGKNSVKQMVKNTDAYLKAMDRYNVSIIAHLLKGIKTDIRVIAEYAKERNVHIEINEKNLVFTQNEFDILRDTGCKLIINSDAHYIENIGKIDYALEQSKLAGWNPDVFSNWNKLPNLNFNKSVINTN